MTMLTATQFDIFGSERAADPTGRRRSLAEHTERCNLCCVPFENTELPPVGHFFYLGFHICERCKAVFDEAAEDKRAGRKVTKYREVMACTTSTSSDPDRYITKHGSGFLVRLPPDASGNRPSVGKFATMREARAARDEALRTPVGVIAIVIDGVIAGFVGAARHLSALIGRSIAGMEHMPIDSDAITEQLLDLAVDTGIIKEEALRKHVYRYDAMIAEIYDNIAYNRLNFNDVEG